MFFIRLASIYVQFMTIIIEKLTSNGLKVDIYEDGDCVIAAPAAGFFQLPADVIARMALCTAKQDRPPKTKTQSTSCTASSIKRPITPVIAIAPQCSLDADAPAIDAEVKSRIVTNATIRRRVTHLDGPDIGWECIIMIDGQQDIRQVYEGRKFARLASPETAIGTDGRIA